MGSQKLICAKLSSVYVNSLDFMGDLVDVDAVVGGLLRIIAVSTLKSREIIH